MKLGIFTPYPDTFPSPRFRIYQFLDRLERAGIECSVFHAISSSVHERFAVSGSPIRHSLLHLYEAFSTARNIAKARRFDIVLVQKGVTPSRLRFFASLLAARSKRLIYDIDDAVHLEMESRFRAPLHLLQDPKEATRLMGHADLVFCGNRLIAEDVSTWNDNPVIVPTVVDCERFKPTRAIGSGLPTPIVVWSGSRSTHRHLIPILPLLAGLCRVLPMKVRVVSSSLAGIDPSLFPPGTFEFRRWTQEGEVEAIASADVGIMPMPDDPWSSRKCGFKALACMACGLAVVASPVGVNKEIIRDGENGRLAASSREWETALSELVRDRDLRVRLGVQGRKTVSETYSVEAVFPVIETALRNLVADSKRGGRP